MKKEYIIGALGVFALGGFTAYLISRPKYKNAVSFEINDESERILEEQLDGEGNGSEDKADGIDWNNLPECSESYVYPCKVTKTDGTDRTTDRSTDTGGGTENGGGGTGGGVIGGGGTGSGGGGTDSGGGVIGGGGTGSGGGVIGGGGTGNGGTDTDIGVGGGFTSRTPITGNTGSASESGSESESEAKTESKEKIKDLIPIILIGTTIALSIVSEKI